MAVLQRPTDLEPNPNCGRLIDDVARRASAGRQSGVLPSGLSGGEEGCEERRPGLRWQVQSSTSDEERQLRGWTSFVNDPGYHLGLLLTSDGTSNYGNFHNAQVDALWKQASTEPDQAVRNKLYGQAQEIINVETPWAYLYEYNIVVAERSGVQGYTSYPDGIVRFFQMSNKG